MRRHRIDEITQQLVHGNLLASPASLWLRRHRQLTAGLHRGRFIMSEESGRQETTFTGWVVILQRERQREMMAAWYDWLSGGRVISCDQLDTDDHQWIRPSIIQRRLSALTHTVMHRYHLHIYIHVNWCSTVSQWPNGNMPDCGVRGPRFKSHRGQLCLSWQPLRYTALGTGCTPLLQCLGRLSLPPSVGR